MTVQCMTVLWLYPALAAAQEDAGLRDIRGPVEYPVFPWGTMAVVVIVLLAMAGGVYFYIDRKRKKTLESEIPKLPWQIAQEKIKALLGSDLLAMKQYERFYAELSDILREYIENQFGIRAVEMTTDEFLLSLKNNSSLADNHKRILKQFLEYADMVKFAKFAPNQSDVEEGYEAARKFITQTQSRSGGT